MQTINIPIQQGKWITRSNGSRFYKPQYLADALFQVLGHKYIPTNVILKKTLPGLGATYGEIKSKRHSIIIEPNVPVILGKTNGKPELLGVFGTGTDKKKKNIEAYLKDSSIKYKKLITTPESYNLIKEVVQNRNIKLNLYKDFFCLFDECEKIIQDIDYRESVSQPINDFFLFENKAFVSATVLDMSHPKFKEQNFQTLEIKPTWNYKKDIELIITNQFEFNLAEKLEEIKASKCICIFINKTDSIDKIVNSLNIKDQSKIFCSDKSVKKLKKKGYTEVYENIDLPLMKYNFFTCRFFSAVDIEIKEKPDILILTALKDAKHTMIDPFTESIQIYGRFRKKYHGDNSPFKSLTHFTDFNPHFTVKSKSEIDTTISTFRKTYNELLDKMNTTTDITTKEALLIDLQTMKYNEFLDKDGEYSYFSQDNFYHSERVKGYYSKPSLLEQAYKDTKHFNLLNTVINDSYFNFSIDFFKTSKQPTKEIRKEIINDLVLATNANQYNIEELKKMLRRVNVSDTETGNLMVDAFDYLGVKRIGEIGYTSPSKLKTELNKAKAEKKQKDLFLVVQDQIKEHYKIGDKPTKEETKELLTELYRLNGIDIPITQTSIKIYCEVTADNSKKPAIYTIKGYTLQYRE